MTSQFQENLNSVDTTTYMAEADYRAVVEQLGFKKVGEFAIDRSQRKDKEDSRDTEFLNVYARRDGFILSYDTDAHLSEENNYIARNQATVVCNRIPNKAILTTLGSGYLAEYAENEEDTLLGLYDARQNLISNMKAIETGEISTRSDHGAVIKVFQCGQDVQSFEEQGYDDIDISLEKMKELARNRFDMMPQWVKNMAATFDNSLKPVALSPSEQPKP